MKPNEILTAGRAKRIGIVLASIIAAVGVLGFLVAPPILKSVLVKELSARLQRPVEIAGIAVNPYALSATVRGFAVKERDGSQAFLGFEELHLNLSSLAIFRLKPVVSELRLTGPSLRLVRNPDGSYNASDLIEELLKPSPGPTPEFSVSNIQVSGGRLEFDDQPAGRKHLVSDIAVGLPFVSNFPAQVETFVQPSFSAMVNGAPLALAGRVKPFAETRETVLDLELKDLDIPTYVAYLPLKLPAKFQSGKLFAKLELGFLQHPQQGNSVSLSGSAALKNFLLAEPDGKPAVSLPVLEVAIGAVRYPARQVVLNRVRFQAPELHLTRTERGRLYLIDLLQAAQGGAAAEQAPAQEGPKVAFELKELVIEKGIYHVSDASFRPALEMEFRDLDLSLRNFSNAPDAAADLELATASNLAESLKLASKVKIGPVGLDGSVDLKGLRPEPFAPVLGEFVLFDVVKGGMDVASRFKAEEGEKGWQVALAGLAVTVRDLALRQRGEKQPFLQLPLLALADTEFDLAARSLAVGSLTGEGAKLLVQRGKDGRLNLASLLREPKAAQAPAKDAGAPWKVALKSADLRGYAVRLEDAVPAQPVTLSAGPMDLKASGLSTEKGVKGSVEAKLRIGRQGTLSAAGPLTLEPFSTTLRVNARGLDVVPVQPYFTERLNIVISSGALAANGTLGLERKGEALRVAYKGDAGVSEFASVDKAGAADFLKWKSLFFGGVDVATEPLAVAVKEVALSDFYSRLIISPEGRINLQDILVKAPDEGAAAAPAAGGAPAAPSAPAATPAAAQAAAGSAPAIRVEQVTLQGGNINFTDQFIKPNYSANLTGIGGRVSGLSAEAGTAAELELAGKVDDDAPVEIKGRLNPLAQDLFLDIAGNVTGVELTRLTAYSQRYVGYGIDKGKLSVKVKYHLENRKLSAENNIYLDQLTFGEKVESPDATKLPVLLAVALLKDSRGVIDINLPISGSLDDPQFSVGGIIIRVIVNLITKALTAPFALLAAAFGGGEELSWLDFAPGRAALTAESEAKLKKLAQAMKDRPGLKLDVAGRADPAADTEGLKRARLEAGVKGQKLKDLVKRGESAGSLDQVTVSPEEYEKYLKQVYGDGKFPKPRNLIGFAKDLPPPEMETLILTHTVVSEDDLKRLASDRAQAVKDYLTGAGQVGQERVFLVASVNASQEAKDKAKPSRVDLAVK